MKIDNFTSDDEIIEIEAHSAYEWVKTGHWTKSEFMKWLKLISNLEFNNGIDFEKNRQASL